MATVTDTPGPGDEAAASLHPETMQEANTDPPEPQTAPFPSDAQAREWEAKAQTWLATMPTRRNVTAAEMDSWIDSDISSLPETLKSLPRSLIHGRIISLHKQMRQEPYQAKNDSQVDPPQPRFVRTDQWMPVYSWLESLDTNEVIKSKDISEWLAENPKVKDQLYARHSRYHLMHYIQKLHLKLLRKREKLKGNQPIYSPATATSIPVRVISNGVTVEDIPLPRNFASNISKEEEIYSSRKNEALLRYELLTDLENQLISLLSSHHKGNRIKESTSPPLMKQMSAENTNHQLSITGNHERDATMTLGATPPLDPNCGKKRKEPYSSNSDMIKF